jgi:Alw26I/Eco31I/Esp3I family type II restriction m6 adenine DNA methyltransferase
MIGEIIKKFKQAEKDKTFPFSEWHRKDLFERLVKEFLTNLGYNPDQFNYDDPRGTVEIQLKNDLKAIIYLSSLQENQRFLSNKIKAPIDTIPDPETNKPDYEIALVTNFDTWFFYFDGKEIYATTIERLPNEYETVKSLISRDAIESGKFKEIARKLLHKDDNEPLRQELNILREKIANKILQEKTNLRYIKNPDGTYNNEILNEITTRWITRFLALKLAEDAGISFNFTLRDIRKSFELHGKTAKPVPGAKVKEETLNNAIRTLMSEFERRYNGGIFMYEEGVDYITIPDSAFIDLLDFTTGWAFTIEDARIIGFVYERFLGQEIVIEEDKGKPIATLKNINEARGRRKAGGIYYTPKYIVDYIVENTLGTILKEKTEKIDYAVEKLDCDEFLSTLKEVKSLKVLDPACGSGSFLIKVLAEFVNFYEETREKANLIKEKIDTLKRERTKSPMLFVDDKDIIDLEDKYLPLKKEIEEINSPGTFALRHNIYGVDIDPKAIDIAAFTLMVQVYNELKAGARCPTMINENLKVGNSLVSAITPDKRNGFISRAELEKFKDDITNLIKLREIEKKIDLLDEDELKKLIEENFEDIVDVYISIKGKYPNAIPTPQQKLLDEWHKKAKKEPIEKTFDVLIYQTGLARIFLKEVYFEKIEKIKEKIELEINKPLIRYFNSEKRVLKDKELEEILSDDKRVREELKFIKDRATEISKSQPPKVFNWELEFPEVFFNEDGTLKENPGFDCVVGNPPYELIIGEIYKSLIPYKNVRYSEFSGRKNTFWLFIDVSKGILKQNGRHSFIVPSSLLCDKKTKILREKIFLNAYTYKIISFKESAKVFENVLQSVCVFAYINRNLNSQLDTVNLALGVGMPRIPSEDKFVKRRWDRIINLSPDLSIPLYFSDEIETILLKMKNKEKLSSIIHDIYQGDVNLTNHAFAFTNKETPYPLIRGDQVEAYYIKDWIEAGINKERFVNISKLRKIIDINKINLIRIITQQVANMELVDRLKGALTQKNYVIGNSCNVIHTEDEKVLKMILALINSTFWEFLFRLFSTNNHINIYEIESLPIVRATPDQQAPIISLVDAIIQKKKEYHSISQNIEDYIDLSKANLINLDEFLKMSTQDFEVLSTIKAKTDNFDALRVRIEENFAILEYGIKRKIEEYEEIDEDEDAEVKGKYITEWNFAGEGRIKDIEAIEFLSKVLESIKNFSKAKQKSTWQKIAEVKVPEFNHKVKNAFLKFKSAMQKTKELDEEILKIDRAIDRLVYDLYGLTEEEIQVIEKSVWGDKFEEMYSKLPSKENALKLIEVLKK